MKSYKSVRGLIWLSIGLLVAIALFSLLRFETRLTSLWSVIIYCGLPMAIAVMQLLVLRLSGPMITLVFNLEMSILMGAYSAEVYLQYFDRQPIQNKKPATASLIKSLEELIEGQEALYPVPFVRPDLVPSREGDWHSIYNEDGEELLPLGGVSNALTLFCGEARRTFLTYKSDRYGFNNDDTLWDEPVIDIAMIGDSFTQGVCVDPERHIAGVIRGKFPATINLGRLGTGPLFQLAVIREYLAVKKPKTVLWFLEESNDLWGDLNDERNIAILRRYLDSAFSQNLVAKQHLIDDLLKSTYAKRLDQELVEAKRAQNKPKPKLEPEPVRHEVTLHNLVRILKLTNVRGMLGLGIDESHETLMENLYREYENILANARRFVGSWGGEIHLVFLQSNAKYVGWQTGHSYAKLRRRVMSIADNLGIPVIDIAPVFDAHPAPRSLFQGHYTAEGYELVGHRVLEALEAKGIKPTH